MRALLSLAAFLSAVALLLVLWPEERDGRAPLSIARASDAAATRREPLPPDTAPEESEPAREALALPQAAAPEERVAAQPRTEAGLVLEGCVYLQISPPRTALPGSSSDLDLPVPKPEFVTQAGAGVRARWFDGFERGLIGSAVSDSAGRWRIEADARSLPLSRVQIEVVAEAEGHSSETRRTSGPRKLPAVLTFDHALSAAPAGAGRVLDEHGNPVPYADVRLQASVALDDSPEQLAPRGWFGAEQMAFSIRLHDALSLSDEDGRYALELPETTEPLASYTLSARQGDRSCSLVLASSSLLQRLPDLVLAGATPSLAGRVVGFDGQALPGVRVEARRGEASKEAWSDREGRFRITDLAPGTWDVGVPWDSSATVRVLQPRTDLELRLSPPCVIVSVVDTSGRIVRGPIQAFARRSDGEPDELGALRTNLNETGSAVFPFEDGVEELEILFDAAPAPPISRIVAREERSVDVQLVVEPLVTSPESEEP